MHCHYLPKEYREALTEAGLDKSSEIFPIPQWDMEKHVEDMDFLNVSAAVISLSTPDVHWGDSSKARLLARKANEVGAAAAEAYPNRFGFWATLPAPDVEACLDEIEYAFTVLHADGAKLYSNNNGVYLGDPRLDPIFEELGRRNAVVTVHPTGPKYYPPNVLKGVPIHPLFEYQFDTTRAIGNMMFNRTLKRNPGIKFLCPHMGSLLPLLGGRMNAVANLMVRYNISEEGWVPPDFNSELQDLYYDVSAGFNLPVQIPALKGISSSSRWVIGSDYPFTPAPVGRQLLDDIRNTGLLTEEEKAGILQNNALKLFPRLAPGHG